MIIIIINILYTHTHTQTYTHTHTHTHIGAEITLPIEFQHLILPELHPPHTQLLDLQPLSLRALYNHTYEHMYTHTKHFTHFNPIQTQCFHVLYHTDENVLLGAPTGSGKTIVAELAILRIFRLTPHLKVVYIAPMKALARQRVREWTEMFGAHKNVVELTGDVAPNIHMLRESDIIITYVHMCL